MALIDCPECMKSISDQANACPQCGFPIRQQESKEIFNQTQNNTRIDNKNYSLQLKYENISKWVPIFIWGIIGFLSGAVGVLMFLSIVNISDGVPDRNSPRFFLNCLIPGIIFGIAIYLFGKYASSPSITRKMRFISFIVLTIASSLSWFWAISTFFDTGLFNNFKYTEFLIAGVKGISIILIAELLCWNLNLYKWLYIIIVLVSTIVAGTLTYISIHGSLFLYVGLSIWQSVVLASHVIAIIVARKRLVSE